MPIYSKDIYKMKCVLNLFKNIKKRFEADNV